MYYELVILNVMILKYLVHYIIESNNCLLLEWRSILLFHIFFLFQLITMLPVTTSGLRPGDHSYFQELPFLGRPRIRCNWPSRFQIWTKMFLMLRHRSKHSLFYYWNPSQICRHLLSCHYRVRPGTRCYAWRLLSNRSVTNIKHGGHGESASEAWRWRPSERPRFDGICTIPRSTCC